MRTRVVERDGVRFVECLEGIARVDDALGLISACAEHQTARLFVDGAFFPEAFFDLSSRFAGEFLQKLQNYRVRLAAILPSEVDHSEKFREFFSEARRGPQFRAFVDRREAETWLCSK